MSWWIYKKDKDGKTSIYTEPVLPVELIMIFVGLLMAMVGPRYFHNSTQLGIDSLTLTILGFALLFISKITLFRRGIWNSWGAKLMSKPFKYIYWSGYILIGLGILGSAFFIKIS
jgi:hypothetical protein